MGRSKTDVGENSRHQGRRKGLEEQRHRHRQARQVRSESRTERKYTKEKGNNGEEQRNQEESEHESAQIVISIRMQELMRHTSLRIKVLFPGRVEGEGGMNRPAVHILVAVRAADGKEGPSCWIRDVCVTVRYAICGSLQKVDEVEGCAFDGTREDDEEVEDYAAG